MQINFDKVWINEKLQDIQITQIKNNVYNVQLFFNNEQISFDITESQKQMIIDTFLK